MARPRKHERAKVGDVFGARTVTALLGGNYGGRLDERVAWKCSCGEVGSSFVYNLRSSASCRHGRHSKICVCGEHQDDHRPNGGECLEDDCDCTSFRPRPRH